MAFDAGNLKVVALGIRRNWADRKLILCADNDSGPSSNIGLEKAKEAALAVGVLINSFHGG